MKLKISFDKKAIGHFFLEHAEKVLLGLFILVFATIIYGAVMGREKFDKTPRDLSDKCATAERSLSGERPELLKPFDTTRDYKKDDQKITELGNKKGVSVGPYESDVAWDKPIFGMKSERDQPDLIDVVDLRATAEFGAFQITSTPTADAATRTARDGRGGRIGAGVRAAPASASIAGRRWVVITGLVPVEKQASAYRKTFRDAVAYDPEKDALPEYAGYIVDRAEINSAKDETNPTWTKKFNFSQSQLEEATKDWAQQQVDVVDPRYTDPVFTYPLGPLQNRTWGKTIAHYPEIPIFDPQAAMNLGTDGQTADAGNAGDFATERKDNPPAAPRATTVPIRGMMGQRRGTATRQDRGVVSDSERVEYKLLRFFDFSVKPGKSYIYRVRLVLRNPNYGIEANKLKKPELAQKRYLETPDATQYTTQLDKIYTTSLVKIDKSQLDNLNITPLAKLDLTQLENLDIKQLAKLDIDKLDKLDIAQKEAMKKWLAGVQSMKKQIAASQTNRIYIPKDTQVLVGVPKTKTDDLAPGKFPLVLLKWIEDTGQEGYSYLPSIERGQVINLIKESFSPVVKPDEQSYRQPTDAETVKNTDFITDATVLDMDGGKKLVGKDRKLTEPREMLFMVVSGKSLTLMVRNELDDMSEVNRTTEPEPPKAPTGRGNPGTRGGAGERILLNQPTGEGNTRRPPIRP